MEPVALSDDIGIDGADIRQIARTGWRPLVVAIIGLTVVASVSLGIVLLTSRVFGWSAGT